MGHMSPEFHLDWFVIFNLQWIM